MIQRGEIRWYRFSKPDKRRPVLVLTRDSALEFLNEATIAPLTRSIRNIPSEVLLKSSDGVPQDSAINLDHIQTVSKARLGGLITTVGSSTMNEVRKALTFALGF
jgi:mRNA interferase MazF